LLKSAGRNWHRYFQSFPIKFLSMPEAYISRNKCQFLILAPMGDRGEGGLADPRLTPWATFFRPDKSGLTSSTNF
jgi:hypothetical protein